MVSVDDFLQIKDCFYKGEHYSVRDNGAVMRHARTGKRVRKDDNVWTFGKPNDKTGYMEFAGQRVHRIVAFAFHGAPPTDQYVVDHIDTNRRNNRPENLRWLTRLENVLNNPITRAKIEILCGSIEAFLADPSVLRGHVKADPNFSWMRAVSPEEAHVSLERLKKWAKEHPKPQGGMLDEWVFQEKKSASTSNMFISNQPLQPVEPEPVEDSNETQSLTPNAVQIDWRIPSEFPCCPQNISDNPLVVYQSNLKPKNIFCKNNVYSSLVLNSAITDAGKSLWVMTKSSDEAIKPWALAKITYKDGVFFHENRGSFFREDGALKYFTLAQGKEWTGGDVFDDYC